MYTTLHEPVKRGQGEVFPGLTTFWRPRHCSPIFAICSTVKRITSIGLMSVIGYCVTIFQQIRLFHGMSLW